MRKFMILLISCLGLFPLTLQAGSGHSHGAASVSSQQIAQYAEFQLEKFVSSDTVEKTWSRTPIERVETSVEENKRFWVVTLENKKVTNPEEQRLKIFFDESGYYKEFKLLPLVK